MILQPNPENNRLMLWDEADDSVIAVEHVRFFIQGDPDLEPQTSTKIELNNNFKKAADLLPEPKKFVVCAGIDYPMDRMG
ncbi:MAG: hypothetical protein DI551_06630, partial [Micavibrio aeruginosavorus]